MVKEIIPLGTNISWLDEVGKSKSIFKLYWNEIEDTSTETSNHRWKMNI